MSFVRRDERGQAIVLMTLSLVVIMGMAALVLDVGNWFHTKRRLQGTADAAALAGAQLLPNDSSGAQSQALAYANKKIGPSATHFVFASTIEIVKLFFANPIRAGLSRVRRLPLARSVRMR